MKRVLLSFFTFLFFLNLAFPALAQEPPLYPKKKDYRDSLDFLLDDGKMSPEEMEEEAIGVYNRCATHMLKKQYYDCECIGGKFLTMREEVGPYKEQFLMIEEIYTNPGDCVSDASIAGDQFSSCMNSVGIYRAKTSPEEQQQYCECIGREATKAFTANPGLSKGALTNMGSRAIVTCNAKYPYDPFQ